MEIAVVLEQIVLLLLIGLIGFAAGKTKYLPENSHKVISTLVVKITAPLMVATKLYHMEFGAEDYVSGVKLYFSAVFLVMAGYGISLLLGKLLGLQGGTKRIFSTQMMFGNTIYFALPLLSVLSEVLPDLWGKSPAYAMFFILGSDTVMWTLGISLISGKEGESWKTRMKHLFNPNSIAFLAGLVFLATKAQTAFAKVPFLSTLMEKLTDVGSMTAILSMLFIGLMLSKVSLQGLWKEKRQVVALFISSGVKMLVLPGIALLVFWLFPEFLSTEPAKTLLVEIAMPAATLVAALAGQYDCDPEFATEGVFVSTVLLMATLPTVLWISNFVL